MAASLDAILNIKANVTGDGALAKLAGGIGGVTTAAGKAGSGLKGLAGNAGGLGSALGGLVPLLSAAGLVAMGKAAINAADDMNDMAQKTGVSVENLSKFQQAAKMSGTSIEGVQTGLLKLAKAMQASARSGFGDSIKEDAEKAKLAIERGERAATAAVQRGADDRMAVLDRETGRRLDKLGKRYRREEQLLNDSYDDQAAAADEAAQDQIDAQEKAITRRYDALRRAVDNDKSLSDSARTAYLQSLEDQRDAELEVLRDNATRAQTIRQRAARDARQEAQDRLDEERKAEEDAIKSTTETKKKAIQEATRVQVDSIKESADARKKALGVDQEATDQLDELGLSGKGASEAFKFLQIELNNANGSMKSTDEVMLEVADKFSKMPDGVKKSTLAMQLFGKSGADLIPMLNGGRESIESLAATMTTDFAQAADALNDNTEKLQAKFLVMGVQIGTALLPVLQAITNEIMWMVSGFMNLDPTTQKVIGVLVGLVIAVAALAPTIMAVVPIITFLVGVIGSAIGAIGTMVAAISSLGGIVSVIGMIGTALAAIVGWPLLIVAGIVAAVAVIFTFREQILEFFAWLGEAFVAAFTVIAEIGYKLFLEPWVKLWTMIRTPVENLFKWLADISLKAMTALGQMGYKLFLEPWVKLWGAVRAPVVSVFNSVVATVRSALNGLVSFWGNVVNNVIRIANNVIRGLNRLPNVKIGLIQEVSVPRFAQGGFVDGETLAVLGDNRSGREYAIPEEKVVGFANNILAGRRGAGAIPGAGGASAPPGSPPVAINITTGPVRRDEAGTDWMTMEDGQRMVREALAQYARVARTPGGRYSVGTR